MIWWQFTSVIKAEKKINYIKFLCIGSYAIVNTCIVHSTLSCGICTSSSVSSNEEVEAATSKPLDGGTDKLTLWLTKPTIGSNSDVRKGPTFMNGTLPEINQKAVNF